MTKDKCCGFLPSAIDHKHKKCFETFIQQDSLCVNKFYKDDLPLTLALENGLDEFIDILLKNGADPNKKDKSGRTFLHAVASFGKFEYLKQLIETGSNVNEENDFGETPLHFVVEDKSVEHLQCLEFLIKNGANVNVKNKNGESPLDNSMKYKNEDAVKILLENGSEQPKEKDIRFANLDNFDNFYSLLKFHNVNSKIDFKKWMLKNHPDKIRGGNVKESTKLFQEMMEAAKEVGYFSN